MRVFILWSILGLLFASCAGVKHHGSRRAAKIEREVLRSSVFAQSFTGFTLLDPSSGKTLADVHGDNYFTPASNTKILTLATCLEVLKDSIPGIQVMHSGSDLVFRGTGDPTFLHPAFQHWQACRDTLTAQKTERLLYSTDAVPINRFGPGWAWEDYRYHFQAEISSMPIYGNTVRYSADGLGPVSVLPVIFQRWFSASPDSSAPALQRSEFDNAWTYNPQKEVPERFSPFRVNVFETLLQDTLKRPVAAYQTSLNKTQKFRNIYSTPLDTALRMMMYHSDNFIAEQMLLVCATQKTGAMKTENIIQWMLDSTWRLPQKPQWVDGSGLSRYNQFSPQSIAQVLLHLWKTQKHERLLSLFPAGGVSGTIQDWYPGVNGKPYVFAKTGGMGGVHCLSGYVQCDSGKVLIFSFMHNNFQGSNRAWKMEMQRILEQIRRI